MTRVDVIDSIEVFESLQDAWNDLARRDGRPLPYHRHEWLASWWHGFGSDATLAIVVAREGTTLTAAAPLMRSRRSLAGIPVRALHGLGLNVGFVDFLRDPAREDDLGLVLDAALRDSTSDVVLVRGTESGSAKEGWIREWLARKRIAYETTKHGEFYFDVRDGVESYRAGRSSRIREGATKRARQLESRGQVHYDRVSAADAWDTALEDALRVSLKSWKARSGTAIGQQPSFRRFLEELGKRFGVTGEAELCLLRVGGEAIAFRMGVSDRETFVDHEIAFDETWARYSPGRLVALHSDAALIRSGIREINLGFDFAWKADWGPLRRERVEWILYSSGRIRATAARAARALRARVPRWGTAPAPERGSHP